MEDVVVARLIANNPYTEAMIDKTLASRNRDPRYLTDVYKSDIHEAQTLARRFENLSLTSTVADEPSSVKRYFVLAFDLLEQNPSKSWELGTADYGSEHQLVIRPETQKSRLELSSLHAIIRFNLHSGVLLAEGVADRRERGKAVTVNIDNLEGTYTEARHTVFINDLIRFLLALLGS